MENIVLVKNKKKIHILSTNKFIFFSYRVVHFEGMSHNPVFTYQVTIGEMTAIGTGNSKKQAKHAAARKWNIFQIIFEIIK